MRFLLTGVLALGIFAVTAAEGAEVRDLRRRLGLDPAYASRMLRSLERAGLVEVVVEPSDAGCESCA